MTSCIRRLAALVVLSVWTTGLALPLAGAHGRIADDAACNVTVLSTPHPIVQIEAVHPPADDGHCATCHLQRAIRGALAPQPAVSAGAGVHLAEILFGGGHRSSAPPLHVPSRAPPSAHV